MSGSYFVFLKLLFTFLNNSIKIFWCHHISFFLLKGQCFGVLRSLCYLWAMYNRTDGKVGNSV